MAKDDNTPAPVVVTLDDETIKNIVKTVNNHGFARRQNFASSFDDVEFMTGAMAVFDALGIWDKVPPIWTINATSGRPSFTKEM